MQRHIARLSKFACKKKKKKKRLCVLQCFEKFISREHKHPKHIYFSPFLLSPFIIIFLPLSQTYARCRGISRNVFIYAHPCFLIITSCLLRPLLLLLLLFFFFFLYHSEMRKKKKKITTLQSVRVRSLYSLSTNHDNSQRCRNCVFITN